MRVLLDEGLDPRLIALFKIHEVSTMKRMGWLGITNGELLKRADAEFDAFVTSDKSIPYQQNLRERRLIIAILRVPNMRLSTVSPLIPKLELALNAAEPGQVLTIQ